MACFTELSPDARKELWATLALRHARDIGALRAKRLAEHFGSALAAVEAGLSSPRAWAILKNIPQRATLDFIAGSWRARAAAEWTAVQQHDCSFLLWTDERYPDALRQIADAPLLLYYKGDLSLLRGPAMAVVGARRCTREGVAVSAFFARDLSKAGVTVVSGMALGIDRAAHLAGMEGPGKSIAVLGTGIDLCYPPPNRDLYDLLGEQGLLLSEFPPGAGALAPHFPVRNRLISGLSQGVLVVEAANRSGSLITARLALEQNRDVFAVPGHTMASVSAGCRELIRIGAKAVFNADDILHELAPLLALEAQKALEQRRRELRKKKSPAREPANDDYTDMQNSTEAVLPQGSLPWIAGSSPATSAVPERSQAGDMRQAYAEGDVSRQPSRRAVPVPDLGEPPADGTSAARPEVRAESRSRNRPAPPALSHEESRIMAGLSSRQTHIDALALTLDMDVSRLSGLLTMLEVRGLVRRAPGMLYSLP